jgi:beta-mannosidase
MIRDWMGKEVRGMSLEDYCYWAGLFQCEALREYADNFRRRMFDSAAAAFWDFNDFWPVTRGWAIVGADYRRAPAFHAVRKAFAPITVVVTADDKDVTIFGVNDGHETCDATLRYGVFELSGKYPIDKTERVKLAANASTRLATFTRAQWTNPNESAAFATLSRDGEVIARNRLLLSRFKDLRWPRAEVKVRTEKGQAIFQSSTFAWAVCLDLNGESPMADNFFDLYPDQPHTIEWPEAEAPRILKVGNLSS